MNKELFLQPLRFGNGLVSPCSIRDWGIVHLFAQHRQLSHKGMGQSEWSLCKDLQMEDALYLWSEEKSEEKAGNA